MKKIIWVVSGNRNEYFNFRLRKQQEWDAQFGRNDEFPEYRYVSGPNSIRGLHYIEGFYVGSFDERVDIDEIRAIILNIKSRYVKPKSKIFVYVNGVLQIENQDYVLSETTLGDDVVTFHLSPQDGAALQFIDSNGNSEYGSGDGNTNCWII